MLLATTGSAITFQTMPNVKFMLSALGVLVAVVLFNTEQPEAPQDKSISDDHSTYNMKIHAQHNTLPIKAV